MNQVEAPVSVGARARAAARWTWRYRWPLLRLTAALAVVAAVAGFAYSNRETSAFPRHDLPAGFVPPPPPTTVPLPPSAGVLPVVGGSTVTSVPPNEGTATLRGRVTARDGTSVPGAVVRVERAIGGGFQVFDVVAGGDGSYVVERIGGGRYRVRAFLPPTFAQARAEVFFLEDGTTRDLDLLVDRFGAIEVALSVSPDPPEVGDDVTVVARVTGRVVDQDGVVRTAPLIGAGVTLDVEGPWTTAQPQGEVFTDVDGRATFAFTCARAQGFTTVTATARSTADGSSATTSRTVDPCTEPVEPTTTTSGATTSTSQPTTTTSTPPTTAP